MGYCSASRQSARFRQAGVSVRWTSPALRHSLRRRMRNFSTKWRRTSTSVRGVQRERACSLRSGVRSRLCGGMWSGPRARCPKATWTAASMGAAAGGPVGVVVGAGLGFAVDYALAKGLEVAGRRELESDVAFALRTAQGEWRYAMEMEARRRSPLESRAPCLLYTSPSPRD